MMSDEYDPGSLDDSSSSSSCRKRRRRGGGITLGGGRLFPGLKEYVVHLLTFRSENYSDTDFAERTLMNLGRKITKYGDSELSEWEKCVRLRDPNTNCVRVARPRDSRMAVSRTPGGGVKKVYPAIIVSQIFRFPQVVFHNDIRSVRECAHQAPVKKERPPSDEAEDLICVNPYHYEMTLEAYARLKKKQTKPQTQWQNESNSSNNNNNISSNHHNNNNNNSNVNNNNSETTPRPRPFIESELIRDLQLYDLNKRKAIQDLESLKLLGIRNGIRSVVKEKYPKLPVQDSDGPVDEGLIQNLLEDIRGSFERQFDDDLNALATNSVMSGTFPYPQESPWNQHQPPPAFPGGGAGGVPGHPPHPPDWNASNYLNVDFDHYFPPGGPHHPHPPHSMSSYHHHLPQQSVFNYDNQNHASTSYSPYDSAAAHGSLQ